jgi:hypothetical protein
MHVLAYYESWTVTSGLGLMARGGLRGVVKRENSFSFTGGFKVKGVLLAYGSGLSLIIKELLRLLMEEQGTERWLLRG